MKRSIFAIPAAILLAGTAQAAITTNLVQDFEGDVPHHLLRWDGSSNYDPADPASGDEMLGGFATNRWMMADTFVPSNNGKMKMKSKKQNARGAIYTITADQFSGANPNTELSFDVGDIANEGTVYAEVYGIVNPGTAGDSVKYSVLFTPLLNATGSGSVTLLGSKTIGGLADNDVPEVQAKHTISFSYNGTDDIAICLYIIGTSAANKTALIDNVMVTTDDTVYFPPTVSLDPSDELAIYVEDAAGVATGTVDVAYLEGSLGTNVTISSVSVVDQTHSGAFTNATALPLTLATPGVSEDLFIAFDNTTAGLAEGGTATGVVQVIWNEVGSPSSSTSTVPVSATYLPVNDSNIIALFNSGGPSADDRLSGLSAQILLDDGANIPRDKNKGCNDGSYGTLAGNAPTEGGTFKISRNSGLVATLAITNNTGYDVVLDSLHFDFIKQWSVSPEAVDVSIRGDVTSALLLDNTIANVSTYGTVGNNTLADYADFDVALTNLADHTLLHGEGLEIEFAFVRGDSTSPAATFLDNIAVLGSGVNGAELRRDPGIEHLTVTRLDTTLSEVVEMFYTEGDAATNLVFNGVSFTNETHVGAFSASGLIAGLSTPETTQEVVTVTFDNGSAQLAAGETAQATLLLSWNEAGVGERVYEMDFYASRPADAPSGVVALFNTHYVMPDAAIDGVLGHWEGERGRDENFGSTDGTYGTLASPEAPTNGYSWAVNYKLGLVCTMTVTNGSAKDILLSSLSFDMSRRWSQSPDSCTLSVSGDVTADPALLVVSDIPTSTGLLSDFTDYKASLTHLPDHTLGTGESIVFTFTFGGGETNPDTQTGVDNIALMAVDGFDGWAFDMELTEGVNDAPTDNPDGDAMDNLMEYATGCDPLTADAAATLSHAEETGTNWFYHVYAERTDDASLTFTLEARDMLGIGADWSDADLEFLGESAETDGFKSVTNRTDLGTTEFIRLTVDQD